MLQSDRHLLINKNIENETIFLLFMLVYDANLSCVVGR